MWGWYVRGHASVKAAARPTVYVLDNVALTAYQSGTFQPRAPRKMSAVTNDATWDFHLNIGGLFTTGPNHF